MEDSLKEEKAPDVAVQMLRVSTHLLILPFEHVVRLSRLTPYLEPHENRRKS